MTMMSAGTGGFSGSADATGPVAGFDPVMKFKKKLKKKKEAVKEGRENPQQPSRLFQYKINVPEVGETIVYANSPAELRMKLRMLIMPKYRSGINIERIMPGASAKFFMDKRMKHMKNVSESAGDQQMKNQMNQQKIQNMKKKVMLKKQELQKQLQLKTQQLKKQARTGVEQDATR